MALKLVINVRQSENLGTVQQIEKFTSVKLSFQYDSVASTFEFEIPFDPEDKEIVEIIGISHIHECSIYDVVDGKEELMLTGYLLSQALKDSATPELMKVAGYSRPGAIEDCDIAITAYPLETEGLSLKQVAEKLIKPFGFTLVIDSSAISKAKALLPANEKDQEALSDTDMGKSTGPESTNIKSYLTEIATARNIVFSHTKDGNLLITAANTNTEPILDLDENSPGVLDMTMTYNGQAMHSEITVIRQADEDGGNAAEFTISNPFVPIVYRPKVVTLTSGNDITMDQCARNELGKNLKGISLVISLNYSKVNGKFITPNNVITVKNRRCYLYTQEKWFIEKVDFEEDPETKRCVLTCVVPFVYNYYTQNIPDYNRPTKPKVGPFNYFIDPHSNLPAS